MPRFCHKHTPQMGPGMTLKQQELFFMVLRRLASSRSSGWLYSQVRALALAFWWLLVFSIWGGKQRESGRQRDTTFLIMFCHFKISIVFFFILETGFQGVQLRSNLLEDDLNFRSSCCCFLNAGITGVRHSAWPWCLFPRAAAHRTSCSYFPRFYLQTPSPWPWDFKLLMWEDTSQSVEMSVLVPPSCWVIYHPTYLSPR